MRRKQPQDNAQPSSGGQRRLRVGERIRHILSKVLREESFLDPHLAEVSSLSVSAVDVSPDLKNAVAYVMPLAGRNAEHVVEALNRAAGFLRSSVAPELEMRYTPRLSFRLDTSFDEAERVSKLLNQERVQRDLNAPSSDED